MAKSIINNVQTLVNAIDSIHDSGFKLDEIDYDTIKKTITINVSEYEYKGKLIQRRTDNIRAEHKLVLSFIENCEIIVKDSNGYQACCEDYLNCADVDNKTVTIKSMFHDIIIECSKISGELISLDTDA